MAPPDLFKDLKFFILQRVPSRLSLVAAVKDHGGSIVPLEKSADILIGDHARKDVPPGFTSWYFITESVKNGSLEDQEKHRISTHAKSAGPTAAGTAKGTRIAFTKEDDDLLRLWVALPANREAGTSGNVIFKQLAEKNPRHTWQSWRDRWVKKLALTTPTTTGGPSHPEEQGEPRRETPSALTTSAVASTTKGSRVPFTQGDDDYLRAWILRPENAGAATNGNKLFQELAEENPRHTWHSWRDRWIKKVAPSATAIPSTRNPPARRGTEPREADVKPKPQVGDSSPRPSPTRKAPPSSPLPAKLVQAARQPASPARQDHAEADVEARSNSSANQADDSFPPVRNVAATQRSEGSRPSSKQSRTSSETAARDQFYENFQSYRAAIEKPLVSSVTITRRAVDMWDLWSAVTSQDDDPELRDWEDISKQLGFDWVSNPTVTHQLKKAFEVHLRDFELLRKEYLKAQQEFDDESESDAGSQSLGQEAERASSPAVQSPPSVAGTKRTWDQTFEPGFRSSISFGHSPTKRREYDRDEVVPESPEVTARSAASISEPSPIQSPVHPPTPAPFANISAPQQAPYSQAIPTSRAVEPETQDFGVIYESRDRSPSPSPSQQLRLESMSVCSNPSPLARKSARKISPSARLLASRASEPSKATVISSGSSSSRESSPTARVSARVQRDAGSKRRPTPSRRQHSRSNGPVEGAKSSPERSSSLDSAFNLEEEVDRLVSLGLDASVVIKAFKCTNMNKHLAGSVLNALCEHKPIPEQRGVWTSTDDGALRYITERTLAQAPEKLGSAARDRRARMARQRARLVAKHGEEALEERRIFLRDWAVPQGYEDADKTAEGPMRRERAS